MLLQPDTGVRYVLVRVPSSEEGLLYEGHAHLSELAWPLRVRVSPAGEPRVELGELTLDDPHGNAAALDGAALVKEASALVRAALKPQGAPPRRISRWRPLRSSEG
jgi:hypothetical protein